MDVEWGWGGRIEGLGFRTFNICEWLRERRRGAEMRVWGLGFGAVHPEEVRVAVGCVWGVGSRVWGMGLRVVHSGDLRVVVRESWG